MNLFRSEDQTMNCSPSIMRKNMNLKNKTCTCNKFQLDELPCEHTLVVLKELNQEPYTYSSHLYTKEAMLATYEATVYPLPSQSTWCIPNAIKDMVVLPPKGRIRAGRPKKTRFKNPWGNKIRK